MTVRWDPALWRLVEPVLDRALELEESARAAYLEEAFSAEPFASQPQLRSEVESLLAADAEAGGVLDAPLGALLSGEVPTDALTGATLAQPRELGPYRLLGQLGAGGMGVVFEAEDRRLERRVALKVLPREHTPSQAQLARFEREARGLARLNHPHIVTLYSVEEVEGTPFITMELIEGVTLSSVIPPGGLPARRCLRFAVALASALAAAHERQIVHRDLKPANVMVDRDDHLKVLDFGLVKLTSEDSDRVERPTREYRTATGVVMGTVPYMSPEQLEGRAVDARSDLFSFGVILYEMATGRRPFDGDSSASIMSAILRDTPRPPGELRPDLPAGLEPIIVRCLEKEPEHRYAAAAELRDDLLELERELESDALLASRPRPASARSKWRRTVWATGAAAAATLLVVFLGARMAGRGDDRRDDAPSPSTLVAAGLPEVASDPEDPAALTGDMDAYFEYLRGVRAASQATDVERFLRAVEHFERAVDLDPDFGEAWARLSSYRAMAVANGLYPPDRRDAMVEAVERELSRASELAPDAIATRLARGHFHYYIQKEFDRAFEALAAVAAQRPDDVEVVKAMGSIQRRRGEYEDSIAWYERAMELAPSDTEAIQAAAQTCLAMRRHRCAAELLDRSIVLDPNSSPTYVERARVEVKGFGRVERARTFLEQSPTGDVALQELARYERDWPRYLDALAAIEPPRSGASLGMWHLLVGFARRQLGDDEEARRHFEAALEISEQLFVEADRLAERAPVLRGLALAYLGRSEEAVRLARSLPDVLENGDRYRGPLVGQFEAEILTAAGEHDRAIDQLERMLGIPYQYAITVHDLRLDPIWDPLRQHPRFLALVERAARDAGA